MELQNFRQVWPGIYLFDLFRYLIPASIAFVIFWVFGRNTFRHLFIQSKFPGNKQFVREFLYSMSTVVIFSMVGYVTISARRSGLTQSYNDIATYGTLYLVFSFALTLIFHDFYFYWTHRLMHHKLIFKYVHRVHHESTNPSPWAAYAFHPWEALIQSLVLPIMLFLFPLHPLTIFLFLTYMIIRNVIGHLGFEIFPKGWTNNKWLGWTTAVTHHNMHHERFNTNYGLYFTWWDRWMKTEDKDYQQKFNEVKSRRKTQLVTTAVLILLTTCSFAQEQKSFDKWNWLLGQWQGEGNGQPGQGNGTASFSLDLDSKVIVRKTHSEYPPANGRPKVIHDDLMIIYLDYTGNPSRAIYFDNEGHVINYSVSYNDKTIVLLSDKVPNIPFFRLTYSLLDDKTVNTKFEISQDGEKFQTYVEGKTKKI